MANVRSEGLTWAGMVLHIFTVFSFFILHHCIFYFTPLLLLLPESQYLNLKNTKNTKVVLFVHNANAFDSKRVIYTLMRYNLLNPFTECVAGFVDTLSLFKKVLPERKTYS